MATRDEAAEAVLETITALAKNTTSLVDDHTAAVLLEQSLALSALAESYAWLRSPNQPHGGGLVKAPQS